MDEIAARAAASDSLFGFGREVLVPFLDYDHAKPFLVPDVTAEAWKPTPLDDATVRRELASYMEFAWEKAEGHRGISAGRSIQKLTEWVWLLGDDATLAAIEAAEYPMYGCPKLAVISRAYNLPIPDREAVQRMIVGRSCSAGCLGCSS